MGRRPDRLAIPERAERSRWEHFEKDPSPDRLAVCVTGCQSWFRIGRVDEDRFWTLIALLGDDHEVERLSAALTQLDERELLSFHDRLASATSKLITEAHAEQLVSDVNDPPGSRSAMSEDVFEFTRLAVVASGRATWASVVQDPTKLTGSWPMAIGEEILDAVRTAYEETTENPWPDLTLSGPPESQLPPLPRRSWLSITVNEQDDQGRKVRLPKDYRDHLMYLEHVVSEDQAWWQWWDEARGGEPTLECRVDFDRGRRPGTSMREAKDWAGRDTVICVIRTTPPQDPGETRERGAAGPGLARQHFDLLFAQLKRATDSYRQSNYPTPLSWSSVGADGPVHSATP